LKKRLLIMVFLCCACANPAFAQSASLPESSSSPSAPAQTNAQFFAAANEVLGVMSKLLGLPEKSPLRESIRTKEQIRAFLVQQEKKDETPKQKYIDQRTLEAFGLIPRGFPLNSYLLDLLTNQVAGLYDPAKKEFFIASWIDPEDQKPVMAHELTHALDDQYFHLDKWEKADRKNDDATLARQSVIEGSAVASMLDYSLAAMHTGVRNLPDISPLILESVAADTSKDPNFAKAPPYVRDELLFPYLAGAVFTQQFLKANSGWPDFKKVFANPPVSTQQILHPQLYLRGVKPRAVKLPNVKAALHGGYRKLDENVIGEFALGEVLKQFLGEDRADQLSPMWAGDRYAVYENKKTKKIVLVILLALDNAKDTEQFFTGYRDALEKKHGVKSPAYERGEYADLGGDVYLRCIADECLSVEGASSRAFNALLLELGWPPEQTIYAIPDGRSGEASPHFGRN
jgi:hypothetical protein